MYKLQELKDNKTDPHPEDVNKHFEDIAENFKSKILYDALVEIRKEKMYSGNEPGQLWNMGLGLAILKIHYANGVITKFRPIKIKLEPNSLPPEKREAFNNLWDNKYLMFSYGYEIRNPNIDYHITEEYKQRKKKEKSSKEK
jgi:hypothetical protein